VGEYINFLREVKLSDFNGLCMGTPRFDNAVGGNIQNQLLEAANVVKPTLSSSSGSSNVYVGPDMNLPQVMKQEIVPNEGKGNVIQGSYGMNNGIDKLYDFAQKEVHRINKQVPGFFESPKFGMNQATAVSAKFENIDIADTNYSLAFVNFVMSFKKANDVLNTDVTEDSFMVTNQEDPRDMLEYMTVFQDYVKIC
jgi:hypothetical protein